MRDEELKMKREDVEQIEAKWISFMWNQNARWTGPALSYEMWDKIQESSFLRIVLITFHFNDATHKEVISVEDTVYAVTESMDFLTVQKQPRKEPAIPSGSTEAESDMPWLLATSGGRRSLESGFSAVVQSWPQWYPCAVTDTPEDKSKEW